DTLVVFGLARLFVVGAAGLEERLGGDGLVLAITVGRRLIGLDRLAERVHAVEKADLVFARGSDVQLGLRRYLAVRAVLDQLLIHADRFVHRRKKRDVTPELEPLAGQKTVGDFKLAVQHLLIILNLRVFFEQLLVLLESPLILMPGLVAAAQKILRLGGVIGLRPDLLRATRGLERDGVVLVVEGRLGDLQLVLGAGANPFAATDRFVHPAFTRTINQRRRTREGEGEHAKCDQRQANSPTVHRCRP